MFIIQPVSQAGFLHWPVSQPLDRLVTWSWHNALQNPCHCRGKKCQTRHPTFGSQVTPIAQLFHCATDCICLHPGLSLSMHSIISLHSWLQKPRVYSQNWWRSWPSRLSPMSMAKAVEAPTRLSGSTRMLCSTAVSTQHAMMLCQTLSVVILCKGMQAAGQWDPWMQFLVWPHIGSAMCRTEEVSHGFQTYSGWCFSFLFVCRQACTAVSLYMKKMATAMENGEYDFDGTQERKVSLLFQCYCHFLGPITVKF